MTGEKPATPHARSARTRRDRSRAAIIQAAREIFAVEGFELRVSEVARRAGVADQTVYGHFTSKDLLIVEAFEKELDLFEEEVEETLQGDGAMAALQAFLRLLCNSVYRPLVQIAFQQEHNVVPFEAGSLLRQLELLLDTILQAAVRERLVQDQQVETGEVAEVFAYAALRRIGRDRPRTTDEADPIVSLMLHLITSAMGIDSAVLDISEREDDLDLDLDVEVDAHND